MAPQFLFVNKDAGSASLTRSSASEQTFINSHVQRGRRHRRSAANAGRSSGNRTRNSSTRETAALSDESSPAGSKPREPAAQDSDLGANDTLTHGSEGHQATLPSRTGAWSKTTRHTDGIKPLSKPKARKINGPPLASQSALEQTTNQKSTILLNSPQPLSSPRDITQVTSTSLDPFGQSVVKLDPHVAKLCRYFCENYHPSVWHAESWTSREGSYTHQTSAPEVVRRAMQSEVEMNAMLACMAARIENVDLIPNQGTDRYMGNALMAVRRRFSSAPRHQLLLIVFHLYAGEAYRQNYQAAKIHMQAAKALFESWGGLDYVPDPCLKELFIIGDGHMSAVLLEPCSLPCEYDPGPYWRVTPPIFQLASQQDLSHIAPAFQALCRDGFFPDELVQAIQETAECAWVLQYAPLGAPETSKHAARWLQWRHAAVRYRLLAMKYPDSTLDAIRVALLMWILTSMVILGLKRLGGLIAPKLRIMLVTGDFPYHWKGLVQVKMWVLTVGAMCAMVGSEDEQWFIDQLVEIGLPEYIRRFRESRPDYETVDVLRGFQEKFFYYDPIQRLRLDRLARLISGGPSETPSSVSRSTPSDPGRKSRSPT